MAVRRSLLFFSFQCFLAQGFLPGQQQWRVAPAAARQSRVALGSSTSSTSSTSSASNEEPRSTVLTKGQQNRGKRSGSFITGELRPFAMKLHTRQQAPKEGGTIVKEEEQKKPVSKWEPTRAGYLQFLVDSRAVYQTFDDVVQGREELAQLRETGLERVAALDEDIPWLAADPSLGEPLDVPEVGEAGSAYTAVIQEISADLPRFLNHYYNYYFAHTAGGRMIGKKLSDELLGGTTLQFYQWPAAGDGDVKDLLAKTAGDIDGMALSWSREEKDRCLEETAPAFKYGGSLLGYLK